MATPSIGAASSGTTQKPAIKGIVDQNLVDAAVKATKIEGSGTGGDFDPNMFLKLLMEQLKNQNPFDAVDTAQILQQQATLTQVEQVTRQTESLKAVQADIENNFASVSQTLISMRDLLKDIKNK